MLACRSTPQRDHAGLAARHPPGLFDQDVRSSPPCCWRGWSTARGRSTAAERPGVRASKNLAWCAAKFTAIDRHTAAAPYLGLPVMDGYELARRLRGFPGLDGIKLLAVTGYGEAKDQDAARRAGFDEHMVKPIDLQSLDAAITRLMDPAKGADPNASPKQC
jgi:DNA-binding NarL/FixJ family response regulator